MNLRTSVVGFLLIECLYCLANTDAVGSSAPEFEDVTDEITSDGIVLDRSKRSRFKR